MANELMCANLIEHYLRTRGRRYFRGHHDGDYFFVTNARMCTSGRLHVHLEISPAHGDVLIVRVTPACFFPATERPWLVHFSDTWNRDEHEVTAIVHGSCDPQRIGVVARRSHWIRRNTSFEEFAAFVDRTIADATDLFDALSPAAQPSTAHPLLRDAG
ncbi:hypothetical protein U8D42_25650 [Mycobacterium europaeum]|uniref:hypothetical protein n=1 Tax=Mycobacterium europaeum TaxID=761804 RepID=UPI002AE02CB7|nr:hypothetical protein [Mycobacterium europaeum]MEA1161122.1 hypothetical protein [Mycobacterium europaeum]